MISCILVLIFISLYIVFKWKNRRFHEVSKSLGKTASSLPFIGISHLFVGDGEVIMKGIEKAGRQVLEKKGIAAEWLGNNFFVLIADPVLADHVFKSCLEKHDVMVKCIGLVLGYSSIVAPVPIWRKNRRMITPTFSSKSIKEYLNIFATQSEILVQQVKPLVDTTIPILQYYTKYTMEILCQTTLGVQFDTQRVTSLHPYMTAIEQASDIIGDRLVKPWLHNNFIYKLLPPYKTLIKLRDYGDQFLNELIYSLKQQSLDRKKKSTAISLMELLVEASKNETILDKEIREEVLGVLVAGTQGTAIAAATISYLLAKHPDVQEKLFKELTEVFGSHGPITSEGLSRSTYLDAVIKESIRLFPPVPIVAREVKKDCKLPGGVVVPAGSGVVLHLWACNRSPAQWGGDAEQFRPERFLAPSHPHLASFSMGPRNCFGQRYAMTSLSVVIATALRHFRFAPAASGSGSTDRPADGLRLTYKVAAKDINDYPVQLKLRNP